MLDTEKRIGQMIMTGFRGTRVDSSHPIVQQIRRYNIGSIIYFDYDVANKRPLMNVESPEQLRRLSGDLQDAAPSPLLIATDQEGGKVNRMKEEFGFPPSVSAQFLGTKNDLAATRAAASTTALTLAGAGITLNVSPCVDLNLDPNNPIIGKKERSFSENPDIVTAHAREVIKAHHEHGVRCCLKHFPGHGSSSTDTHLDFVDVTTTWKEIELQPYRTLVSEGLVDSVMTSHVFNGNLDRSYPATLSHSIVTGILRERLGFNGVIISDDMQMKGLTSRYGLETAVEKAVEAGVDILSFGNNMENDPDIVPTVVTIIMNLMRTGVVSEERINESFERIQRLKRQVVEGTSLA